IKSDEAQGDSVRWNTLGDKISDIPIRTLICADRPAAFKTPQFFAPFLHQSEVTRKPGCFTRHPTGEHVDILLRESAEGLVLFAARLHAAHQLVVLFVIQNRKGILGMPPQDALELCLDLWAIIGV